MELQQPDKRKSAQQEHGHLVGLQKEETAGTSGSVPPKTPGKEDEGNYSRGLCQGGTFACSAYRSIRQLKEIYGE